jgi:hypothetical protein
LTLRTDIVAILVPGVGQVLIGRPWKGLFIFVFALLPVGISLGTVVVHIDTLLATLYLNHFVYYIRPANAFQWALLLGGVSVWLLGYLDFRAAQAQTSTRPECFSAAAGRQLGWRRGLIWAMVILEVELLVVGSCIEGPSRRVLDAARQSEARSKATRGAAQHK